MDSRTRVVVSQLLEQSLRIALDELEIRLSRGERLDWASTCLSLSLIFLAVESLQVDIHLRCSNAETMCMGTETMAIRTLAYLFAAHTKGFSPLWLDWAADENLSLINRDRHVRNSLANIQRLSQEYGKFRCSCGHESN